MKRKWEESKARKNVRNNMNSSFNNKYKRTKK